MLIFFFLLGKFDDVKGEFILFFKDKVLVVSLEFVQKGKEKQCYQWNNVQDDFLSQILDLVQFDLINFLLVFDYNIDLFRADLKNQLDDSYYDLIFTLIMEICRVLENEMEGKVVCDFEYIGIYVVEF